MPYSFLYYVYKVCEFAHNSAQNVPPSFYPIIKPANMQILTLAPAQFSAEKFIYRTHAWLHEELLWRRSTKIIIIFILPYSFKYFQT
jgi:hypothetical protein